MTARTQSSLASWMRMAPQPARVRVRTEDDETKEVQLAENWRTRWRAAEETINSMRCVEVELLSKEGAVLRARKIEPPPVEGESPEDVDRRKEEQRIGKERRDLASLFDAYGRQLNTAFERGAAAASASHDAMVALTQVLTENLALAINNLHAVSANFANLAQTVGQKPEAEPDQNTQMLAGVLAQVARQVGMGGGTPPNGKAGT